MHRVTCAARVNCHQCLHNPCGLCTAHCAFVPMEQGHGFNPKPVQGLGVSQESVNKDLLLYKSILSKMSAAKVCLPELACEHTWLLQLPQAPRHRA
jgi:hypothetical protein